MPCNAVVNARFKVPIKDIEIDDTFVKAVVNLLNTAGSNAELVSTSYRTYYLTVDGKEVIINSSRIRSSSTKYAELVKWACEEIAGAIQQEKIANVIRNNYIVKNEQNVNGYLVMKVII